MDFYVALTSLGCSKNLVDSEIMLGILKDDNYILTKDFKKADIIIVNTCGFILPAKQESIDTILKMAKYKKVGRCQMLIVTGCLTQKYGKELKKEIPEIDEILGTSDFSRIGELVNARFKQPEAQSSCNAPLAYAKRHLTTPKHTAYVKISEGCNNKCTYCLIPELRGNYQSRPMEEIVTEVRFLISQGVKEINLIAQDTTYYGLDLYGEEKLAELLEEISKENIHWIRVFYCYPGRITQKFLDVIASHDNICNYLDIPLQHVDQKILKRMGRKETKESLERLIQKIRQSIPDISLRTTLMVGFPGETEEEFQTLLDFVQEQGFDWLGAFTYSQEEDTPAALFPDQIPEEIKEERFHRLMTLQHQISSENQKKWLGKTISVLIEGKSSDNPEYFMGRTEYQAPDVDGVVLIKSDSSLKAGDIVNVLVTDTDVYDLIGEVSIQ
ncbi:MAG: 30S ribosomal protein S12 methylthiotransferase RimO [Bacillota bacterium]